MHCTYQYSICFATKSLRNLIVVTLALVSAAGVRCPDAVDMTTC